MFRSKLSLKKIISILLITIMLVLFIMPIIYKNTSYAQSRAVKSINEFPESYRHYLNTLKQKYPNWTFTYFDTGLEWNNVIEAEAKTRPYVSSASQLNVIENRGGEWLCTCCDNSGRWKHISRKAISYYMDPRNFLNESAIFQFEPLTYISSYQTKAGVEKILAGTFMQGSNILYKDGGGNQQVINKSYADVIMETASAYNINPYHLASRIKQEVTKSGGVASDSVTGTVPGYEGLYNFFNIQATEPNGVANGLQYARDGKNAEQWVKDKYLIPWTNPETAIKGGAIYIAGNYISIGQDSIYLQKYDIVESGGLYNHQYMQNVSAPQAEANKVFTAYSNLGLTNSAINFVIPVYRNMPSNPSPIPSDVPTLINITLSGTEAILDPNVTVSSINAAYPGASITGANGDLIGTGARININGTTYVAIKLGDVNGDAKVNLSDALLIERHYVGLTTLVNEFQRAGSIANRNTSVTLTDALKVKRHYVELEYIRQ